MMRVLRFRNVLDGEMEPNKSHLVHMKRQFQKLLIPMFIRAPGLLLSTSSTPLAEDNDEDTSEHPSEVVSSEKQ